MAKKEDKENDRLIYDMQLFRFRYVRAVVKIEIEA